MLRKRSFEFYIAKTDDFGAMVDVLLAQIKTNKIIVRLVFFGDSENPEEYRRQLNTINKKVGLIFREIAPPVSYIAQKPLTGGLLLEVSAIEDQSGEKVGHADHSGVRYITIRNDFYKELIISGVMTDRLDGGTYEQATEVFEKISSILSLEKMPVNSIVRQWNYIENITALSSEEQNYHQFNRARTAFYEKTIWENGYPAATGIGIKTGGVIVEIDAVLCLSPSIKNIPLNNEFQVPAYQYSEQVLAGGDHGLKTPKFERARFLGSPGQAYVYISGTAAIRGEQSVEDAGAAEQTRITIENIYNLITTENLNLCGCSECIEPHFEVFIVYLKNESDFEAIKGFIEKDYPSVSPVYLLADICREELLVEIEAVVCFNPT
jgi:enamine deaminase RidA (YjgF/YER057c/UK114 family)